MPSSVSSGGSFIAASTWIVMAEGEIDSAEEPWLEMMLMRARPACLAMNSNCQLSARALCLVSPAATMGGWSTRVFST
ncbi:MAG: hypothetical protein EON54_20975 [Alcaligenaceae bacterium]|nr:MAG: hypothetical protein EON54_20975 [Alcaligenaceae bacterium]